MPWHEFSPIQIVNNRIAGNTDYGIESSGHGRTIRGNSIYGNGVGLQVHSGQVTATNNLVYDNDYHAIAIASGDVNLTKQYRSP